MPLSFIPNGCESDICLSLGVADMDNALDYVCKAECIPIDTTRVLIDADNEG